MTRQPSPVTCSSFSSIIGCRTRGRCSTPPGADLFESPEKIDILGRLTQTVAHGRDNELLVIMVDLLELAGHWQPLLKAVRVAVARHHQVVFVAHGRPACRRLRISVEARVPFRLSTRRSSSSSIRERRWSSLICTAIIKLTSDWKSNSAVCGFRFFVPRILTPWPFSSTE